MEGTALEATGFVSIRKKGETTTRNSSVEGNRRVIKSDGPQCGSLWGKKWFEALGKRDASGKH